MYVVWTQSGLVAFSQIKSKYFSDEETREYKEKLFLEIEKEILKTGTMFPSLKIKKRYYTKIKPFIVSYKISSDNSHYIVVAIKHARQNKKH